MSHYHQLDNNVIHSRNIIPVANLHSQNNAAVPFPRVASFRSHNLDLTQTDFPDLSMARVFLSCVTEAVASAPQPGSPKVTIRALLDSGSGSNWLSEAGGCQLEHL